MENNQKNGFNTLARFSIGAACLVLALPVYSEGSDEMPDDLTTMSLEQLMDIEVTSVAKKPQKKSQAAAAIFVLTGEDMRRLGVTDIPDALRYVPGLQVGQIDANKWAVSSRGFNGRFSNKLLVLIDGRSVYTPLFAGVYWEAQHVPIAEIERIEVIRGPGGTLWGANAVNGVINIITREASKSAGGLITAGFGDEVQGQGSARWGGSFGENGAYRVYGSWFSRDTAFNATGSHDDWQLGQGGFRADWSGGDRDRFTLQGDYYDASAGEMLTTPVAPAAAFGAPAAVTSFTEDVDLTGQNLLFRWGRDLSEDSNFSLQVYYDHVGIDGAVLFEDRDIIDIDFQHRFAWLENHDVIWGAGYRNTRDDTRANELFSLTPSDRNVDLFSAFVQDEIQFMDDRLAITIGTKVEHNDFTGMEIQPSIRAAWLPDSRQTWWAAVSRAVRTPARGEHDVRLRVNPPVPALAAATIAIVGDDTYESEELVAYEMGYRARPADNWSVDVALYYNDYDDLRTFDFAPSALGLNATFDNNMRGTATGGEVAIEWQPQERWRVRGSYSFLDLDLELENGSVSSAALAESASPSHQATLWASVDLTSSVELDAGLRYVDEISIQGRDVAAYVELDARVGWRVTSNIDFSLVGRNLLDSHHSEFMPTFIGSQPTEIERSVYGLLNWRF